ncbi:hypothetical protein BC835DRAFT_1423157 [Cytidiella melzeri]|nr:hypothetical protein BC835DRAFT_1423157 [Cytidiella melzeri]
MSVVNDIKNLVIGSRLFVDADKLNQAKPSGKGSKRGRFARIVVKIGQGGTLDPLADGVLVVYKKALRVLRLRQGPQEYRTTALFGCETDSFDSQGAVVRVAPWKHITREQVDSALDCQPEQGVA